jgi:hypothetical protein
MPNALVSGEWNEIDKNGIDDTRYPGFFLG